MPSKHVALRGLKRRKTKDGNGEMRGESGEIRTDIVHITSCPLPQINLNIVLLMTSGTIRRMKMAARKMNSSRPCRELKDSDRREEKTCGSRW